MQLKMDKLSLVFWVSGRSWLPAPVPLISGFCSLSAFSLPYSTTPLVVARRPHKVRSVIVSRPVVVVPLPDRQLKVGKVTRTVVPPPVVPPAVQLPDQPAVVKPRVALPHPDMISLLVRTIRIEQRKAAKGAKARKAPTLL